MNATYKNKLGNATIGVACAVGWAMVTVVLTVLTGGLKLSKLAIEQGEKLAIKGQVYCANKVGENLVRAGSDTKEAYNLYRTKSIEAKKEEKVELIDEGYSSGSEENNSKLPSSKKKTT